MGARPPTQRQLRVGEELRHALVRILGRAHFRDPDLAEAASITVTEVRTSPDLRNATAYITPLGGADLDRVVAALNRASGFVRGEIGHEISLKFVPKIAFEADTSFDYSSRIEDILHRPDVARDLGTEHGEDHAGEGGRGGENGA